MAIAEDLRLTSDEPPEPDTPEPLSTSGRPGRAEEHERVVRRTQRLLHAVEDVTLEEFRAEDAHFERNSRLGRELLFLLSNNDWSRRTTEVVDISQVHAVDTTIVVDVDLSYVDHEAFQPDQGLVWLPLLMLPLSRPSYQDEDEARWVPWRSRQQHPGGPRGARLTRAADPITSLEVADASGARVAKVPHAQVHQWIAAALAELLLNVMASRPQLLLGEITSPTVEREQKLLLSAAIRRLLPGSADGGPPEIGAAMPQGVREARRRLREALATDIETAEAAAEAARHEQTAGGAHSPGSAWVSPPYPPADTAPRPRPVLGSRIGEILQALVGTVIVVVGVEEGKRPASFTVTVPSRRLRQSGRDLIRLQPRARVSIDLLSPTTHADRLIRLVLPDGVVCVDEGRVASMARTGRAGRAGRTPPAEEPGGRKGRRRPVTVARIDVVLPAPFERLDTLMQRLLPQDLPADRMASWLDGRLAEVALHKVDAALESLRYYEVTRVRAPGRLADALPGGAVDDPASVTEEVDLRLRRLRNQLDEIRRLRPGSRSITPLRTAWDDGSWFPARMRRRLSVNTASPGSVLIRATAVEEVTQRARPTRARIDAEVAVFDSPVFNVARYTGTMNLLVLGVLAAVLTWRQARSEDQFQRELLATVLTLFSAVQASRVEHPDGSTLRGVLSQASYWLLIASVLPTVLLALAFAVVPPERADDAARIALLFQLLLVWRLRRGPMPRPLNGRPPLTLATEYAPDHASADGLRSAWCRSLTAEAMLLGREAFAYVVSRPAGEGRFTGLLDGALRAPSRVDERLAAARRAANRVLGTAPKDRASGSLGPAVNLLGVAQSATAGRTLSYLVFREKPVDGWPAPLSPPDPADVVTAVPLDAERLAPTEPPEWILEVLIGLPELPMATLLSGHPVLTVLEAAARYNFRVQGVQLPAMPPPRDVSHEDDDAPPRRWMRLRVNVSYRRGDTLRGLRSFLLAVEALRSASPEAGLAVAVRVAPDQPTQPGKGRASRALTDRDFDVVPDEEAANDPVRRWRALAICQQSRTGGLHDLLGALAQERPAFELAGMSVTAVHGQTVVFVLGRDAADPDVSGDDLPAALAARARPSDRLTVAVDERLAARTLDGSAAAQDRLLLQVGVRAPDRPGVLRDTLEHLRLAIAEHAPHGVQVPGLDIWFAKLRVVDGRSTRGRLTLRLPGGPDRWREWQDADWAAVERAVARAGALAIRADPVDPRRAGWASPLLDDTVISVHLLRAPA